MRTPPRLPSWTTVFRERPQTVAQYIASGPTRRTPEHGVLSLLPLGRMEGRHDLLEPMRAYAEAFFGMPVRIEPARPMIEEGWSPQRRSSNASILLDRLAPAVSPEALVTFALVEGDLFARGLPYVFGEGQFETRVAVGSISRFGADRPDVTLRRVLRLLTHEICHGLSIAHCQAPGCLLRGANTLEEFDRQDLEPCREDLEKIRWNTGVDLEARARRIRDLLGRVGLAGAETENHVLPSARGA